MRASLVLLALALLACTAVCATARSLPRHDSAADLAAAVQPSESLLMNAAVWPQGELIEDEHGNSTSAANGWVLYRQCGQSWSNNRLGTSSITICQAGCAMSSVAMALKTRGSNVDPGTFNSWLINNGGYVSGNLLVWGAANAFGTMKLQNYYRGYGSLSQSSLRGMINNRQPIVVNVKNGGHWVLVTGYAGGNTYTVNDPGFSAVNSYEYGAMGNFVVYA